MNYVFGTIFIIIGLFFIISAYKKSEFIIYKILIARSKLLWKDNVHNFYKIVGLLFIIFGILYFFKVF